MRIISALFSTAILLSSWGQAETLAPTLTLEQAKDMAHRNNPGVRASRERLEQARLLIDKAWSAFKPQWTATGTYTHYNTGMSLTIPDFTSIGTSPEACGPMWDPDIGFCFTRYEDMVIQKQDSFNFFTQITQPIFVPRVITAVRSAYKAFDISRLSQENSEEYLIYGVEVAYYGALAARRFVDIAHSAVELRRETLSVAKARVEAGGAPRITELSAEISLNQAEQDMRSAENSYQLSKEALRLLCGQREDFELQVPAERGHPAEGPQQLLREAFGRRRDLQVAKMQLQLADISKTDAWYRFLPSLVAVGNLRVADVKGFTNEYTTWNVGLVLSLPLYDGGLRYAYMKEAESRIRQAEIELEGLRDSIASEIRQLWLRMEMAEANLQKARRSVELAREQVKLARASFDAGASTHLEVVEANTALFLAEVNEAQQSLNLQLALLRLEKSTTMFNPVGSMSLEGAPAAESAPVSPSTSTGSSASSAASSSMSAGSEGF